MIDIIIPSYNQSPYLPDAIESALSQTTRARGIIVIDDGSTDGSLSLARGYEKYGVKVISQVNKGLASARNTGIMNSAADYIFPLDADDIMMESCIGRIEDVITETDADIIAPSFRCFGFESAEVTLAEGLTAKDFAMANRVGYFSAFRRSKALEIGGYSPRMTWGYEDFHFWMDLLKRGASIEVIREPLVLYRIKELSMITTAKEHHDELMAQILKDHPEVYEGIIKTKNA